jgi:hypothetical protein
MGEEILGTIYAGKQKFSGVDQFLLCFTPKRIIVAKAGGSGLGTAVAFGGIGAAVRMRAASKRARDLKKLSVESLMKTDKANFEIPYSDITKVEMKKGGMMTASVLRVSTLKDEYKFNPVEKKLFDEQVNLVRSVLSDKLSIK